MTLRVVELFAGIGAQAMALEELGIPFTSTVCENEKYAYASYCAIHGCAENLGDIRQVARIPEADLVTWTFPCQDLSVASGTQKGFVEGSGTRSALAWEVIRLLGTAAFDGMLPEYLVMENVPAILNKRNLSEFKRLVGALDALGYTSSYEVLNAKDYGVPQNRKRCFMVSALHHKKFVFPAPCPDGRVLKDLLEPAEVIPDKLWLPEEVMAKYDAHWKSRPEASAGAVECVGERERGQPCPIMRWPAATIKGYMDARDGDGLVMARPTLGRGTVQPWQSPTITCGNTTGVCLLDAKERPPAMEEGDVCAMITPGRRHKRQEGRRFKDPGEPAFTTTTQDRHGVAEVSGGRLRARCLTSREAWRLMGFSDSAYDAAKAVPTSDAQLYKQAGNSIAVPCLKAIFKGMFIDGTWEADPRKGAERWATITATPTAGG